MDRQVPVGYAAALLASFLFGWAITPSRGAYSEPAMAMVVFATLVVAWRYAVDFRARLDLVPARVIAPLAWAGCLAMAFTAYNDPEIIIYPVKHFEQGRKAQGWLLIALLAWLPAMLRWPEPRALRHVRFAFAAACLLFAGHDTIKTSPTPRIDVWTIQQLGAKALLEGKNPYLEVHAAETGPSGLTDVPYVYPPMQVYVTAPAWKLFGDVRYTMLAALVLFGFAVRAVATRFGGKELPAIIEDAPALFIWCTPKLFFILEQSWVDPVQIFWCSALVLAAAYDRPWLSAVLVGLVIAAKQTMFLLAGLLGLGLRFNWRQWAVAGAVGLSTVLPWMIWDFKAWKWANFDLLSSLPVRPDALTYITWVKRRFGADIPYQLAFPAAFLVVGLAAWKGGRSLGKVTMAAVAAMTIFFVINKWAFANYYFTLAALSALAAAATLGEQAAAAAHAKPSDAGPQDPAVKPAA